MAGYVKRRRLPDGTWLRELIDRVTNRVIVLDADGNPTTQTRDLTPAEHAEADREAVEADEVAARAALVAAVRADILTLEARADPVAKAVARLARLATRTYPEEA